MDDIEKERLRALIYQFSEVSHEEFKSVLLRYKRASGKMRLIPDYCFDIGVVIGIAAAMFLNTFWFRLLGIVICLFGASQIGKRTENCNGFLEGYENGKLTGICRALEIPEGEEIELLKKTLQQVAEFKVKSAGQTLETTERNQ